MPIIQNGSRPGQVARILHIALTLGVVLITGVFLVMKMAVGFASLDAATGRILVLAGYVVLAVAFIATKITRDRIEAPSAGTELTEWWPANLGKAITLWAVAESTGLVGAIFYLLTGNGPILLLLAGFGLLILFVTRPSRLEGYRPGAGRDVRGFGPRDEGG